MSGDTRPTAHDVRMIDVGEKPVTAREAVASGRVVLAPEAARAIAGNAVPKGDVLTVARIAGIQAAKRTSELVPLCHPLPIQAIDVDLELDDATVVIRCAARAEAKTGVEMEALTGVAAAALTVVDMTKGIAPGAVIERIVLERKTGGTHGDYTRE